VVFNSLTFIAFFAIVLAIHSLPLAWKFRKVNLLIASYRAQTWGVLLAKTGAPGVHFQDHPELQGFWLPEWSHLATHDAVRFTRALYAIVERDVEHHAPAGSSPVGQAGMRNEGGHDP